MPSLTLDDRLIWFAHVPKAGGTSVEKAMVARWGDRVGHLHWGWDRWWRNGGWRVADPPNSPQHLIWADAQRTLPHPPDAVFAVVRDPVARMVSEYRYQRCHRRGTWAGRALTHLPFSLWLRLMLAMARENPHCFDNHFRPQSDFVPKGAEVFRLEDGLEAPLAWLGVMGRARSLTKPPHQLKSGEFPVEVTPGDAALIGDVFARDYTRFGYPPPAGAPITSPRANGLVASLVHGLVALDRQGRL